MPQSLSQMAPRRTVGDTFTNRCVGTQCYAMECHRATGATIDVEAMRVDSCDYLAVSVVWWSITSSNCRVPSGPPQCAENCISLRYLPESIANVVFFFGPCLCNKHTPWKNAWKMLYVTLWAGDFDYSPPSDGAHAREMLLLGCSTVFL